METFFALIGISVTVLAIIRLAKPHVKNISQDTPAPSTEVQQVKVQKEFKDRFEVLINMLNITICNGEALIDTKENHVYMHDMIHKIHLVSKKHEPNRLLIIWECALFPTDIVVSIKQEYNNIVTQPNWKKQEEIVNLLTTEMAGKINKIIGNVVDGL